MAKKETIKVTARKTKLKPSPKGVNPILREMTKGKKYSMMTLVAKVATTRQYVNYLLNKGVNEKQIKREGTRKWYLYYKI